MNSKIVKSVSSIFAISLMFVSGCGSDSDDPAAEPEVLVPGYLTQVTTPSSSAHTTYNVGPVGVDNPKVFEVLENIGSALYMTEVEGNRVFYGATDGGLATDCEAFLTGEAFNEDGSRNDWGPGNDGLFCVDENGDPTDSGKIYLDPTFTPKIVKFELDADGINVLETIAIKGTTIIPPRVDEERTTGAGTNTDFATEYQATQGHNLVGEIIDHSPVGIDPEAIVVLADGSFWVGEEYGPSLVHISATGEVIEHLVPAGTENAYNGSTHTVRYVLPEVIKMRKRNRGIEAIAIDAANNQLVFIMQNALANPEEAVHRTSRLHRMYVLQLDDEGNFDSILHEYLYQAEAGFNGGSKQRDVRISEMRYFDEGQFVVLERDKQNDDPTYTNQVMHLIDVAGATDIWGDSGYDDLEVQDMADNAYDITPVTKTEVFASDATGNSADNTMMPEGTEGFVLLNDQGDVVFISENEYGLEGRDGHVKVVNIPELARD